DGNVIMVLQASDPAQLADAAFMTAAADAAVEHHGTAYTPQVIQQYVHAEAISGESGAKVNVVASALSRAQGVAPAVGLGGAASALRLMNALPGRVSASAVTNPQVITVLADPISAGFTAEQMGDPVLLDALSAGTSMFADGISYTQPNITALHSMALAIG